MIKRFSLILGISILVFAVSEAVNLSLVRDLYESGQEVMAAVADPKLLNEQLAPVSPPEESRPNPDPDYLQAIENTANMVWDENAIRLAKQYGLDILNVTWEDTGRYYNSSVGPNISDVTIQIQHQDPQSGSYALTLMPVIRFPNFSDVTADIQLDKFFLLVGNEDGTDLQKVSLRDYLGDFRRYLSSPGSWNSRESSLLAPRDSHVLVSAQAAFLPVPQEGKAEFNPVIFNYQSYQGDPAVLTIVATREGTSATVIDNVRDGFAAGYSWGQRLFFNQDGERASFTGQRLSDFRTSEQPSGETPRAAGEAGLNMVLIIQVPLKQKFPIEGELAVMEESVAAAPSLGLKSDVEAAVIGHGQVEGPFTEIDGLEIERDPRFPVRVTVQFYKATSNGIVTAEDMEQIHDQIERVYAEADYVGSLVVGGGSDRPTEYEGSKLQPANWWQIFWQRFEQNTGLDQFEAKEIWRRLKFHAYQWSEILRDFSE
jgi:hypothetical protein